MSILFSPAPAILICGCGNAGKTAFIDRWHSDTFSEHASHTMATYVRTVELPKDTQQTRSNWSSIWWQRVRNRSGTLVEIDGGCRIFPMWRHAAAQAQLLVFVVDSTRIAEDMRAKIGRKPGLKSSRPDPAAVAGSGTAEALAEPVGGKHEPAQPDHHWLPFEETIRAGFLMQSEWHYLRYFIGHTEGRSKDWAVLDGANGSNEADAEPMDLREPPIDAPLLLLCNKQDVQEDSSREYRAATCEEIAEYLGLYEITHRHWACLPLSCKTGEGIDKAKSWCVSNLLAAYE